MAILNQNLDFNTIKPEYQRAFQGRPTKELFQPGEQFYRLITANQNHNTPAAWWYTKATFKELTRMAHAFNKSVPEIARSPLAVTREWNKEMNMLSIIQLNEPVFALKGLISAQPLNEGDNSILLMGGLEQVYMPGLASREQPYNGQYARTVYFGQLDRAVEV